MREGGAGGHVCVVVEELQAENEGQKDRRTMMQSSATKAAAALRRCGCAELRGTQQSVWRRVCSEGVRCEHASM